MIHKMSDKPATRKNSKKLTEMTVDDLLLLIRGENEVLLSKCNNAIDKLTENFSNFQAKTEESNLNIISKIDEVKKDCFNSIQNLTTKVNDIQREFLADKKIKSNSIQDNQNKINTIDKKLTKLSNELEYQENRGRMHSVRIFNFQVEESISSNTNKLADHVYNTIVEPVLASAEVNGDLMSVPQVRNTIEFLHPLPSKPKQSDQNSSHLPVIIMRFTSRLLKLAFCKHKKIFLEAYNRRNHTNIYVSDDRSPTYNKCMAWLRSLNEVEKKSVCVRSGRIRAKLTSGKSITIWNVFTNRLEDALKSV